MKDAEPVVRQVTIREQEVRVPGERIPGIRRIAVVQNGDLDDLVFSLPAIHALREAYPEAWLGVLVRRKLVSLARMTPVIQEVLTGEPGIQELEAAIRAFAPDLMVSLSRGSKAAAVGWRLKVPHRIGTGFRLFSSRFTREVDERSRGGDLHEVDYALSFAHRAGASAGSVRFGIQVPAPAMEGVRNWLNLRKLPDRTVVIHPGEGRHQPAWPAVHFIRLATLMEAEGRRVVFSLDTESRSFLEALEEEPLLLQRLPRFHGNLESRAALFRTASIVIGNGSGSAHLAAALGVPTLTFHPPWRPAGVDRRGPYGRNGWALEVHCPAARRWSGRKRTRLGSSLMEIITPADAHRCAVAILEGEDPSAALNG